MSWKSLRNALLYLMMTLMFPLNWSIRVLISFTRAIEMR